MHATIVWETYILQNKLNNKIFIISPAMPKTVHIVPNINIIDLKVYALNLR